MGWVYACSLVDLADHAPLGIVLDDVAVCIVRIGAEVFAIHDECTHEPTPLSEGDVEDCTIECWRHGSAFDLRTGRVLSPPASRPVPTYQTRIVDGQVQVRVDR